MYDAEICRDFVGELTTAVALAETAVDVEEAHRACRKRQRGWLNRARIWNAKPKASAEYRPPKRYRVYSWRSLVCLDHQLQKCGIHGLGHFQVDESVHWSKWPLATVSWDQEGINISAAHFFCTKKHSNLNFVWDSAHGSWNDIKLACRDAGLYGLILGLMMAWTSLGLLSEALRELGSINPY